MFTLHVSFLVVSSWERSQKSEIQERPFSSAGISPQQPHQPPHSQRTRRQTEFHIRLILCAFLMYAVGIILSISPLSLHQCWSGSFAGSPFTESLEHGHSLFLQSVWQLLLLWGLANMEVGMNSHFRFLWFFCMNVASSGSRDQPLWKAPGPTLGSTGGTDKNLPASAEDVGSVPGLRSSPGGGNGNPLQYSSRDNAMDRGAWQATVHGYAKNRPQLSDWAHVQAPCPTHNCANK